MSWSTLSDTSQTFILILGCVVLSLLFFIMPMSICVRCCGRSGNRSRKGKKSEVLPLHMKDLTPLSSTLRSTSTSSSGSGGAGERDTTGIKEDAPMASLDRIVFTSLPPRTWDDVANEDITYPKPCYDGAERARMALGWKPEISQNHYRGGMLPLCAGGVDEQVILNAFVAASASSTPMVARTIVSTAAMHSDVRARRRKAILPPRVWALEAIAEDEAGEEARAEEVAGQPVLSASTKQDCVLGQRKGKEKEEVRKLETVEEAEEEGGVKKTKHEVYTSPKSETGRKTAGQRSCGKRTRNETYRLGNMQ